MTPRILIGTAAALSLLPATAHAHDGEHAALFLANILHWLSSPSHSLFAVIGGVAIAALIIKAARKNRA